MHRVLSRIWTGHVWYAGKGRGCVAKADGMLAILWLLTSRGRLTAQELADHLEIHVRTVYRYIDALCASGVPVMSESGHDGGYRLPPNYQAAPLFLTAEEHAALMHAALFAQRAGYPAQQALERALLKIRQNSTANQKTDVSRRVDGVDVIPTVNHEVYFPFLAEIEDCVAHGRTVSIHYRKPHEESVVERNVDPYGLIHWRERWYVVGFCHLRREARIFRVDRMQACNATNEMFVPPDGFSASSFFTARQIYEGTPQEEVAQVSLEGADDAIEDLASHWFLGPRLIEKGMGKALFLVEERMFASYVPHILLAYGRSIWIREPTTLNDRMVALARDLTGYYSRHP